MRNSTNLSSLLKRWNITRSVARKSFYGILGLSAFGLLGLSHAHAQMPSGTYTVDPNNQPSSTNFTTINAFFTALSNNGNAIASGGARLEIYPGTYTEQITIPNIQGLGPVQGGVDRLVITSHSSGTAKVQYSATGSFSNHNGAVFFLNGADYITFENLEIHNTATQNYQYNWCIQGYTGSDFITVNNCDLKAGLYNGTTYSYGVALGTTDYYAPSGGANNGHDWVVTNNDIEARFGAYFYGYTSSSKKANFTVTGNNFNECGYGVYLYYVEDCEVNDNTFRASHTWSYYGVYARYVNDIDIIGNDMANLSSYPVYLGYINYTGTFTGQSVVANNMIHSYQNTYGYAGYLYYAKNVDMVYNSVYAKRSNGQNMDYFYGYYLYYDMGGTRIQNNVYRAEAGSYLRWFYRYATSSSHSNGHGMDYNTFYSEEVINGNVTQEFYWRDQSGSNSSQTLSAHISATGQNSNSQEADPSFVAPDDLHVNGVQLYAKGTPVASITTDFDGTTRSVTAPSPGIHEYVPKDYDAGVVRFDDPVGQCADTNNITVTVRNYAKLDLDSFRVHWSYTGNGGASGSGTMNVQASVSLKPGEDTTLDLASVVMTSGAPGYNFEAWTTHPNGQQDEQTANDSSLLSTQTAMIDTFTIGATGRDFATFTDAVNAMVSFGVCGPVVFNVDGGTYVEQVSISNLIGTSETNTVLFRKDPNSSTPVEIEYNATTSAEDGVIRIENSSYITFEDISVEALNGGGLATVLWTIGGTDIHFDRVISTCSQTANDFNIYFQGTENASFTNGQIIEGGYGIYAYGNSSNYPFGLDISNNEVVDIERYGLYLFYYDGINIEGNNVNLRSSATTYDYSYGLYIYSYAGNSINVERNYLHSLGYGCYLYLGGSKNIGEINVINNKIQCGDTNSTTAYGYYGLYVNSGFANISHNTIVREKNYSSGGYTCWINGGLNEFYNNFIMTVGSGTSMRVGGSFSVSAASNNAWANYETSNGKPSSGLDYMDGFGLSDNSMEWWDIQIFNSLDSLYTCYDSLVGAGIPLMDVPIDINGYARNAQAPTIGAEEYSSPDAFTLGDDFKLCDGDTAYIGSEVFGATYSWSPGGETTGMIMVTSTGTYSVNMQGGCGAANDEVVVSSGEPNAGFDGGVPSWLTVEFQNTSTNDTAWMWDFDDGTTSTDQHPVHLFPSTDSYNVCLTAYGECGEDTECGEISVSDYVGIADNGLANAVSVAPNPADDVLFVNVNNVSGDVLNIELSNISGQVVITRQLNDFNGTAKEVMDVSDLTGGVYFVKVYTNEASVTHRIIVQE